VSQGRYETITMGSADPHPTSGEPPPEGEEILWLPVPLAEPRDAGNHPARRTYPVAPGHQPEASILVIEDEFDFSRGILPIQKPPRRSEPLSSMMTGSLAIVIGVVNLAALLGRGPKSIPNLVERATIILSTPIGGYGLFKTTPGWWFVPAAGFWVLATSALSLAAIGIVVSRRRGWPITSLAGFVLNTLILIAGYGLAFTNFRE
jgi:hypothetical protein